MDHNEIPVRALQLGERIDVKGLEREDAFSTIPLAFPTSGGGTAVLFKSGAAVSINMTPVDEEDLIRSLSPRIRNPLDERETETARLVVKPQAEELIGTTGTLMWVMPRFARSICMPWGGTEINQTFALTQLHDRIGAYIQPYCRLKARQLI